MHSVGANYSNQFCKAIIFDFVPVKAPGLDAALDSPDDDDSLTKGEDGVRGVGCGILFRGK